MAERKKNIKLWLAEVITKQEDSALVLLIEKHGFKNWKSVSVDLRKKYKISRTPKQCRDRWFNNLKNEKNDDPLSAEEINYLIELYTQLGPQWSKISQLMSSRTENQLKNFMNATVRRNIRKYNRGKLENEKIKVNSLDILQIPEVREILLLKKDVDRKWFADKFLSDQSLMQIEMISFYRNLNNFPQPQNFQLFPAMNPFYPIPYVNYFDQLVLPE